MASNFLIGFLLGVGSGGWIYAKVMRSSGGNTKNALIVAAIGGLVILLLATTLLSKFVK